MRSIFQRFCAVFGLAFFAASANSCPDGQYEQCVFGACICVPDGSHIIPPVIPPALNPLPDTLNILGAVVSGNVGQLSQSVGSLVIKSTCVGCDILAQSVMSKSDKAFMEQVVGRGWLLFVTGVDPIIILADAATSIGQKYAIKRPEANPIQPTPAPNRGVKTYTADPATCAIKSETNKAVVGWINAPTFIDRKTGMKSTCPNVDLIAGDVVLVSSTNECPEVPSGQMKVTSAKVVFDFSQTVPGGTPTTMKFFVFGSASP